MLNMKQPAHRPIYLDNHATTPVDPRVANVIMDAMIDAFGNPNSADHTFGDEAAALVSGSQRQIAQLLDCDPESVHFTSGSSEAISLAFAHAVVTRPQPSRPLRVAASVVEHHAVLDVIDGYLRSGEIEVSWLPVDRYARLHMGALEQALSKGIDLVCVMAANNEVGTLYPIPEITRLAHLAGASTLVDATQAAGRIPLSVREWGVTYLTISAHKMYGPKGAGALITEPHVMVRATRSRLASTGDGTPNVPGIVGLGEACRLRLLEMGQDEPRIALQRDRLETALLANIGNLVVNGDHDHRLSNNLHIAVPDIPNDAVIARLRGLVAISTGAACSSSVESPSHVLQAMGLPVSLQDGALRIGLGKFTTDHEIEQAAVYLAAAILETRRAMEAA